MSRRHRTAAEQIMDALGAGVDGIPNEWYAETLKNVFASGVRQQGKTYRRRPAQPQVMLHRCEHCGIFSFDPETCTHQ